MTIGEFLDALPNAGALSDDERLVAMIGIVFARYRDDYGTPLICFYDYRAVNRFVSLMRKAGYQGIIPLCP
jgi:hypothetical protein